MGTGATVQPSGPWVLLGCCLLCAWALGDLRPLRSLPLLPSQTEPGSVPERIPPQGAEGALAFLYSGDPQQLLRANCSKHYEVPGAEARPGLPPVLQRAAGTLAQAANFLNMLLQANDIREASVEEDVEWYQALVRSVAEGDPRAYRALLTFHPPPGASHLQLALQATRMGVETLLQELAGSRVWGESPAEDLDSPALHKRVLTNDLQSLNSPKWPQGDGYVGDMQQVRLSHPFLDCQEGRLRPGWLVTLSATFYGLKPDLSPEVRGQVQMDVDLQRVDINQCADGPGWFSNTHLCDLNSTQCVPLEGRGFVLDQYLCRCRPGFFGASGSGGLEEDASQTPGQFGSPQDNTGWLLRCQPCPEGCPSCMDATPCLVQEALALRAVVLACQACCMLAVFLSMLVSYQCRWNKASRAPPHSLHVVLLEAILFGSLLLYFPVFILYFKPSVFRCITLRWVRLLGFAIVYGTIILKLYRVLQLFLSRAAQRSAPLGSGRLLRHLGLLLLVVLGFLAVWTAGVLERGQFAPLVTQGHTAAGRHFHLCHHDRSDYIMVGVEVLLLCWGSFLSCATREVPSAFHELRYMGLALHNELLLSAAFHMARFMLVPSLHPDWTLLLFFFHTHSTVTTTLALIFFPMFQRPGAPPHEEILDEAYEDELGLQRLGSYLDSSVASAWSEHSLDPGDIRDELKKLYAQLEVRKTKEMAANNPHLPNKWGSSRHGLGRSFLRYLAEFPEALARQHSRDSGSPGRSSLPSSSCRRLLSSSHQDTPEGGPALCQSHCTYDQHHPEQELPLLGSVLRRNLSRKALRLEGQEPAKGPPALGFRSASAHNLMGGEQLSRAWPSSLQKSLSDMAGRREKALLVASQTYLEETYWQAKERQEQKKAEAATARPVWRPSARRLERAWSPPLSAPPSPAKNSSMDSSLASRRLQEEGGRRLPHPPIHHQVSSPILVLSGACPAEQRMLSPSSTLAPVPTPALAPVSGPPQSPILLTYICPWENAELPVKKETVVQEGALGSHSPALARGKLWRPLSEAVGKRVAMDSEMDAEAGRPEGEADDRAEDRPKTFSKSHSLKTPVQQGSMRSLGLAIKALTRSRSTYREKDGGGEVGPDREKDRAAGAAMAVLPRSPRLGRPKVVSKQAALVPCNDEESLQNQQNAHTSGMLHVCHQDGGREQEAGGRKLSQGPGESKVEKAGKRGLATLWQVFGDKSAEQAKEGPGGRREPPRSGLLLLGSADRGVAEACPWEVIKSDTGGLDSSNKAQICPWEVSKGALQRTASGQHRGDSQEDRGTATGKPEPRGAAVTARRKPERLVRSQEASCPWEGADPGAVGRSSAAGSVDRRQAEKPWAEAPGTEAGSPHPARAELYPWEVGEADQGTRAPGERAAPQAGQSASKKAAFWREQEQGADPEPLCPWESTGFRDPSGSLGSSIAEVCPWEVADAPVPRKAEVCPWKVKEGTEDGTPGQTAKGGDSQKAKEKMPGKAGIQDVTSREKPEVQIPKQEAVCPWESVGSGSLPPLPGPQEPERSRVISQRLGSAGSGAAEVCPWEVEDTPTDGKAQICPWEVGAGAGQERAWGPEGIRSPNATGKTRPGRPAMEGEWAHPWETSGPGGSWQHKDTLDTEGPRAGLQDQGRLGCRPADMCPWEAQEAPTSDKAKICSWEENEGAPGKGLGQELGNQETLEKGRFPLPAGGVAEWEAKLHQEQEAVCPWEDQDLREWSAPVPKASDLSWEVSAEGTQKGELKQDPKTGSFPEHETQGKAPASKAESMTEAGGGTSKAGLSVCPWDTMAPEGSLSHPNSQHPDQMEASSQALGSGGGSIARMCPWDAPDPDVCEAESSAKAELCPREATEKVLERGAWRQDGKGDSREGTGRAQERPEPQQVQETPEMADCRKLGATCPRDSRDGGGVAPQLAPCASEGRRARAKAAGHMGAGAAEVCPWEVEEKPSTQEAEVSPREPGPGGAGEGTPAQGVAGGFQGQGEVLFLKAGSAGAEGDFAAAAVTLGREQDIVGPWDGTGSEGPVPQGDALGADCYKVSRCGAGSGGTRTAELCQWEVTDPEGNKIRGTMADVCPWEDTSAPLEEPGFRALTVAQTENVPKAAEKSLCFSVSFIPESKSSHPKGVKGAKAARSAGSQEGGRALGGPSGLGPRTRVSLELSVQGAEAPKSSSLAEDHGQVASEAQDEYLSPPPAYPWDFE
ncbi:Putative G-protein coupled receptor 179 [Heterocephalus glaber]|uniref:Putative G-protein coupled receptor 179 n=1 Tax=Heterocephalus glaber TaxID=10181 RepID=G5BY32_HETGA|nr:Putative G-protein coupled receptor 179 [Heterocephalus glaber]